MGGGDGEFQAKVYPGVPPMATAVIDPLADPQVAGPKDGFTLSVGGSVNANVWVNWHWLASASITVYIPEHRLVTVAELAPDGIHVYCTEAVTLEGVLTAVPLQPPLQVGLVKLTLASMVGGLVRVITLNAMHKFASVARSV